MRRASVFGVLVMGVVSLSGDDVALQPPTLRSLRGLSPVEQEAAQRADRDDYKKWEAQLTAEQRERWGQLGRARFARWKEQQESPDRWQAEEWRWQAEELGFSPTDVAQLERDKLVIEDRQLKQCFEGYTRPRGPLFVTSDVMLNAFNVLFEDSFRALELSRVGSLRAELEVLVARVRTALAGEQNDFRTTELRPGWELAQRVVGPALRLLGTAPTFFDERVRDDIESEVARIRAAEEIGLPAWWGPPARQLLGIDYRGMRPVGIYAGSERLADYFRAVRWLQSVPLRVDRDDHLTAIALLGDFASYGGGNVLGHYHDLWGRPDDRGLGVANHDFQNVLSGHPTKSPTWPLKLADLRKRLLRENLSKEDGGRLNDGLSWPPGAEEPLANVSYRILPAYRLPESLALAKLGRAGGLPDGLVVAAMLGSAFALDQLGDDSAGQVADAIAEARADWRPAPRPGRGTERASFHDDFLAVLETLAAPADEDAPDFVRGEAWGAKSCQTILAGWAQMRHATTLQAKRSANYLGTVMVPPGFVEPNPDFFARLANLVQRASRSLDQAGAFTPSRAFAAAMCREQATELAAFGLHRGEARYADIRTMAAADQERLQRLLHAAGGDDGMSGIPVSDESGDTNGSFCRFVAAAIEQLNTAAEQLEAGTRAAPASARDLARRWESLGAVARRLEAMTHKQLRGRDWSEDEAEFLRNFGKTIAGLMGYDGNSWLNPRDDAPRWATVASDPATDTLLAVAVGRARPIHVLYPWRGHDVLCHGAVMTYYEYAGREPLADHEWRAWLDSEDAPDLPGWIEPVMAR